MKQLMESNKSINKQPSFSISKAQHLKQEKCQENKEVVFISRTKIRKNQVNAKDQFNLENHKMYNKSCGNFLKQMSNTF